MRIRGALIVCVLAVVLAGCAGPTHSNGSPEETVREYVQARGSGKVAEANAMLTSYAKQHWPLSATAPVPGIEDLSVSEARPVSMKGIAYDHWNSYAEVFVVKATFRTPDTPDTKNLQTSEPVIVVKETPSSPWRIEMDRASD